MAQITHALVQCKGAFTFHKACYEETWQESTYNKCPCRFCLICRKTEMRAKCVGYCECGVDLHYECAKAKDFYCVVCKAPVWPV